MNPQLRRLLALASVLALLLVAVMPVSAGGWATIELEEPVENAVAGEEIAIKFMVLQHGVSPVDYDRVQLTATHAESKESIDVLAKGTGELGHYVALLTVPEPGRWNLEASELDYGLVSSFPTLHVAASEDDLADKPETNDAAKETTGISIKDFGFTQALVTIEPGTTVTWTNEDSIKHEVAFVDLAIDDSGILETGETFSFTFEKPGKYTFVCGPHPGMSGMIEVK